MFSKYICKRFLSVYSLFNTVIPAADEAWSQKWGKVFGEEVIYLEEWMQLEKMGNFGHTFTGANLF